MTGLETAEFLAGGQREITVVEMQKEAAPGMYFMLRSHTLRTLAEKKVTVLTDTRLEKIGPEGAFVKDLAGNTEKLIPADTVILALGVTPDPAAEEPYKALFPQVVRIGDAQRGGKIAQAMKDGFTKAMAFQIIV